MDRETDCRLVDEMNSDLTISLDERTLTYQGRSVRLRGADFYAAKLLFQGSHRIVTAEEIRNELLPRGYSVTPTTIRVVVFNLRLKLQKLTHSRFSVTALYRRGYWLTENPNRPLPAARMRSVEELSAA